MRTAKFTIDFLENYAFQGYTRDERWNGFACPYFTHDQAQHIVQAWRAKCGDAHYDPDTD